MFRGNSKRKEGERMEREESFRDKAMGDDWNREKGKEGREGKGRRKGR